MNGPCHACHCALNACLFLICAALPAHGETATPVKLSALSRQHQLPLPKTSGDITVIRGKNDTLQFGRDSRKLIFNNTLIWLHFPLLEKNGGPTVAQADVESIINPILHPPKRETPPVIIVIDPGHGGTDSGASTTDGLREEKIVLDLARRVRRKLRASNLSVKLTRKWSSTLSLSDRTKKAAGWNADLFLSIHLNYASNTNAAGIETYVLTQSYCPSTGSANGSNGPRPGNRHNGHSTLLAYHVHSQAIAATQADDRGIRRARFEVLSNAPCPAVLVECGFLSNKDEKDKLLLKDYRDSIADGIARGIMSYMRAVSPAKDSAE